MFVVRYKLSCTSKTYPPFPDRGPSRTCLAILCKRAVVLWPECLPISGAMKKLAPCFTSHQMRTERIARILVFSSMKAKTRALPYGIFFGSREIHRELPGFSVSLHAPSLRAEEVPLHTHHSASFVLVLQGSYLSSADGAEPVSPMLIFNPAGTTHRDSFRLAHGRFLAVSISDSNLRMPADGIALPSAARAFVTGKAVKTASCLARQTLQLAPDSTSLLEGLCWQLLSDTVGEKLWREKRSPSWLHRAKELLQDECHRPLLITGIAQQLGVHPVYFARTFKRAFRCTPGEYLIAAAYGQR